MSNLENLDDRRAAMRRRTEGPKTEAQSSGEVIPLPVSETPPQMRPLHQDERLDARGMLEALGKVRSSSRDASDRNPKDGHRYSDREEQ